MILNQTHWLMATSATKITNAFVNMQQPNQKKYLVARVHKMKAVVWPWRDAPMYTMQVPRMSNMGLMITEMNYHPYFADP